MKNKEKRESKNGFKYICGRKIFNKKQLVNLTGDN